MYKCHGDRFIPRADRAPEVGEEIAEFLDMIYDAFGHLSGVRLGDMTHEEPPWKQTRQGAPVPVEVMERHFKTRVTESGRIIGDMASLCDLFARYAYEPSRG
jgi:hypothetical protein